MYSIHTTNYIFGEALNPKDNTRTCGGSSGGDAGLVAAECVPLGVGGDIGGSIRFPAVFCGVYGFKPTQNRVTKRGLVPSRKLKFGEFTHLIGTAGPLGRCVDDLIIGFKALVPP